MKSLRACKVLIILVLVLCCLCRIVTGAAKSSKSVSTGPASSSAPVPRSKSSKKNGVFGGFMQNSFINRIAREVKISFSSELEGLILQLTRPNPSILSMSQLDTLVSFLNTENSPSELVSVLVKLSRKYSENISIFTKLKSLFSVHYIYQHADEATKTSWLKALTSLRQEIDEKTGAEFFCMDNEEDGGILASTSEELAYIPLASMYANFVFNYFDLRVKDKKGGKKSLSSGSGLANGYIKNLQAIEDIEKYAKSNEIFKGSSTGSSLVSQLMDTLKKEKDDICSSLKTLYEGSEEVVEGEVIEDVLKKYGVKFVSRPKSSSAATKKRVEDPVPPLTPLSSTSTSDSSVPSANTTSSSPKAPSIPPSMRANIMRSIDKMTPLPSHNNDTSKAAPPSATTASTPVATSATSAATKAAEVKKVDVGVGGANKKGSSKKANKVSSKVKKTAGKTSPPASAKTAKAAKKSPPTSGKKLSKK